jgi:hypothetical protein
VLRAEISKKDCFAYNDGRNEKEIILNPTKLRNVVQISGDVTTVPAVDVGKFKESDLQCQKEN